MSISIGAITLSDHLVLPGIKNLQKRAGSTRLTLGGRAVHQSIPVSVGQQIFLSDDSGYGLFTTSQIDAINAYKDAATEVEFIHHVGSWTVIIESVEVEQSDGISDFTSTNTWVGTITMRIIG